MSTTEQEIIVECLLYANSFFQRNESSLGLENSNSQQTWKLTILSAIEIPGV